LFSFSTVVVTTTCAADCRVNSVSNAAVRGDSYTEGCLGQTGEYCTLLILLLLLLIDL